ncbi:hypothetical protein SEA_CRUNCHYBOI_27 [Microbacterium phage CrunchyBoi]|nr:hypothetical protein SEA_PINEAPPLEPLUTO_27 [Microbacterium phage PineapplePluto]QQO39370.1 hypothetical protein SEA_CRUNCHYBOI_27 [Microbacterium phage CrunchyBoi]
MNNREFYDKVFGRSPIFDLFMSEGGVTDDEFFMWDFAGPDSDTIVVQENPETFEHRDRNIKYRNIKSLEE